MKGAPQVAPEVAPLDDMIAEVLAKKVNPLADFEAQQPELAAELWAFFDRVKDAGGSIGEAFTVWERRRGPLPCSESHLRNVVNARFKARQRR